jgi:hypothetical protein
LLLTIQNIALHKLYYNKQSFANVIAILIVHLYFNGFGQQYSKIPIDTNYYWRQVSICPNYDYQLRYIKDTTINSKNYNQYGAFGRAFGEGYCSSFIRVGYLRQDTLVKRVCMLDENYIERPLYNFTKNLGDTLLSYDVSLKANKTLTVTYVTTAVLNNGSIRKALWFSNVNCYIEGVGSIFGGLFGCNQPLQSNYRTEELVCFGKRTPFNVLIEGKTALGILCGLVPYNVGFETIVKVQNLFQIHIVPNPIKDKFKLLFEQGKLELKRVSISNPLGQILFILNEPKIEHEIDISLLVAGVYYLTVENQIGTNVFKIIKE